MVFIWKIKNPASIRKQGGKFLRLVYAPMPCSMRNSQGVAAITRLVMSVEATAIVCADRAHSILAVIVVTPSNIHRNNSSKSNSVKCELCFPGDARTISDSSGSAVVSATARKPTMHPKGSRHPKEPASFKCSTPALWCCNAGVMRYDQTNASEARWSLWLFIRFAPVRLVACHG